MNEKDNNIPNCELIGNLIEGQQGGLFAKFKVSEHHENCEAFVQIIKLISFGFEAQYKIKEHQFNNRTHFDPSFATARERIKCIFYYKSKTYTWEGLLPVEYPIIAEPVVTRDIERKRDIHTIILRTYGGGWVLKEVRQTKILRYIEPHQNKVTQLLSVITRQRDTQLITCAPFLKIAS